MFQLVFSSGGRNINFEFNSILIYTNIDTIFVKICQREVASFTRRCEKFYKGKYL